MAKTVLVTGSSRGIGKAIALEFARKGWNVVVNCSKSKDEAESTANEISRLKVGTLAICANVSDKTQVDAMVDKIIKTFGTLDCLVNNAGVAESKLFIDTNVDDYNTIVGTNLIGTMNCCRSVLPHMIKNGGGTIVNTASIWGVCGASMESLYSLSKFGIVGLTKSLSKEYGPSNIRVNAVAPGMIDTQMTKEYNAKTRKVIADKTALCRIGTPEDVAPVVYFLADDASKFVTGQVIVVDGGLLD